MIQNHSLLKAIKQGLGSMRDYLNFGKLVRILVFTLGLALIVLNRPVTAPLSPFWDSEKIGAEKLTKLEPQVYRTTLPKFLRDREVDSTTTKLTLDGTSLPRLHSTRAVRTSQGPSFTLTERSITFRVPTDRDESTTDPRLVCSAYRPSFNARWIDLVGALLIVSSMINFATHESRYVLSRLAIVALLLIPLIAREYDYEPFPAILLPAGSGKQKTISKEYLDHQRYNLLAIDASGREIALNETSWLPNFGSSLRDRLYSREFGLNSEDASPADREECAQYLLDRIADNSEHPGPFHTLIVRRYKHFVPAHTSVPDRRPELTREKFFPLGNPQ